MDTIKTIGEKYHLIDYPFMGIVLLTLGKPGPLVGAIAGNSRLLAPGVLAPSNFE
jgi:hypothetical protein